VVFVHADSSRASAQGPRLVIDDPGRFYLELPAHLERRWVLHLTLPPGPRPLLVWAGDTRTGTADALDALAGRFAGRRVGFLAMDPALVAELFPRMDRLSQQRGLT